MGEKCKTGRGRFSDGTAAFVKPVISAVDYPMSLPQARSFQDLYRILRDLYTTIYSNLLLLRYTMQKEYGRGGRI